MPDCHRILRVLDVSDFIAKTFQEEICFLKFFLAALMVFKHEILW